MNFDEFFKAATGHERGPFDYQRRLACGDRQPGESDHEWLSRGGECQSKLINIPTGLGKTAAAVLAWLWNRIALQNDGWPRRFVYCLPMRTLVEQTEGEVKKWLQNLQAKANELGLSDDAIRQLEWLGKNSPVILMGGEEKDREMVEWDIHPEKPCILIGTQDMLLSRALNRGYGITRARWPMHFGLLNNDCLWVLDETQLMGVGVRTSAQLEGLRRKIGAGIGCATWWASATLDTRLLATPDHQEKASSTNLEDADKENAEVIRRVEAIKRLSPLQLTLSADSSKAVDPYIQKLAAAVMEKHRAGSTTIVILNRVNRARELFRALEKIAKKQSLPERVLVHSRFRLMERESLSKRIKEAAKQAVPHTTQS